VGEVVFEHEIEPLLQERRAAIPEKRVLEHDDLVREQLLLLEVHVDLEIGIGLVKVVKRDAFHLPGGGDQRSVDARLLKRRMREQDENARVRHDLRASWKSRRRKRRAASTQSSSSSFPFLCERK